MSVHLEPGRFYAGVNLPFFITRAMVQHKLEGLGFTNIVFQDREGSEALLAAAVDPRAKYPAYSDDWSEWISADYAGPKKDLDIDKHWAWLLVVPHKDGAPPAPSSGKPDVPDLTSGRMTSGVGLVVGVLVIAIGLALRKA